jgi:hypothetical protein
MGRLASFAADDDRVLKLFGLAMATAVFLDAIVIRTILLLAVLELLVPFPVGREPAAVGSQSNRTWPPTPSLEEPA